MTPIRVVFDTNMYVAAALNPNRYADLWLSDAKDVLNGRITLFVSEPILDELERKLQESRFGIPRPVSDAFLRNVRSAARTVKPRERLRAVKADPDDNKILECAVEARAELIVTMDKHLLRLKEFRTTGICHPTDLRYLFAEVSRDG